MAKLAKSFNMHVVAVTKHPSSKKKTLLKTSGVHAEHDVVVDDLKGLGSLPESIPIADYISIHTPLNNETLAMIGEEEINLMKSQHF